MIANHSEKIVLIDQSDLPLHCPLPSQEKWNLHPRVFLPLDEDDKAKCPYCGAEYQVKK